MVTKRNFRQMLEAQWVQGKFVCVGLDSEYGKIPSCVQLQVRGDRGDVLLCFNRAIIDATHDLVLAYKPNAAFYEQYGSDGWYVLKHTIDYIKEVAPNVPIILDAKRADIGNTNSGYVCAVFDELHADAVTVNPYFGREALQPFLDCKDKGIIVLCRTSNLGAGEFQSLMFDGLTRLQPIPLYQIVAEHVSKYWNQNNNCMLVVGATCPEELAEVRRIVGDMPILIPGIGVQGGDVKATVEAGRDSRGLGMIINSSRGIIFASNGDDFADAARCETVRLNNLINQYRLGGVL